MCIQMFIDSLQFSGIFVSCKKDPVERKGTGNTKASIEVSPAISRVSHWTKQPPWALRPLQT